MSLQNIKIKFTAFDNKVLDKSVSYVANAVKRVGGMICGPIPLPTKIERFTVNKSPHVNKKAREQFRKSHHKRLLMIFDATTEVIEELSKLELPSGVGVEIQLLKK